MHKIIYTGQNAPSDKKTYLWKKKDENGDVALYEYKGTRWEKMAGGSGGGGMIETTYDDLVELRDSGSLSPGTWYRITDYETLVSQEGIFSAGHYFDIAVLALSEDTLSEEAKALHHEGDTYFQNCNLAAWKLQYCLDNDITRFGWAMQANEKYIEADSATIGSPREKFYRDPSHDMTVEEGGQSLTLLAWTNSDAVTIYPAALDESTGTITDAVSIINALIAEASGGFICAFTVPGQAEYHVFSAVDANPLGGKGVIYRMIDEHRNDCPYDFKNIKIGSSLDGSVYTFHFMRSGESTPRDASVTVDENLGILAYDNYIAPSHMHYDSSSDTWSMDKAMYITGCGLRVNTGNTGNYLIHNVKIAEDCYNVRLSAGNLINLDICSGVHDTTSWTVYGDEDSVITIARGKTTDENKMYSITDNMTTFITPSLPH